MGQVVIFFFSFVARALQTCRHGTLYNDPILTASFFSYIALLLYRHTHTDLHHICMH